MAKPLQLWTSVTATACSQGVSKLTPLGVPLHTQVRTVQLIASFAEV